jgi:hypothetical protein
LEGMSDLPCATKFLLAIPDELGSPVRLTAG